MAGVNPVEYIKDSSTAGFAVAGEQKPITDDNANTIKKDVDQGNTKKLDSGQTKFLEGRVDEDTIDYSNDEMKNVGKNQIDTEGTENSNDLKTAGTMAGSAVSGAGFLFASTMLICCKNFESLMNTFFAPLMGGIFLASGVTAIASAKAFDDQYGNRMSQMNTAGDTNQTIQNYYDLMNSDMDTMVEDAEKYKDLSDTKLTSDVDRITQIGALQAQLSVYESQGNQEKVAELQAQIAELTQEGEEDPTGAMLGDLEKGLETCSGNSAEASGVAESGSTVAEFLGDGNKMGAFATVNAVMLGGCAIAGGIMAGKAWLNVTIFTSWMSALGSALSLAGVALYTTAAVKMGNKAKDEFKCADAGSEMQNNINNLRSNIEQQAGFTESTGAEYTTITTENVETTQKVKEGVDKANKNNPTQPVDNNGNGNGNGNGDGNVEEKDPNVEGAAA